MKTVLCIGGSDPSGGAGIQVDAATLIELKVAPLTVTTALTSQNSTGVYDIFIPPPQNLRTQLEVILKDYQVDAVKVGMIGSVENIRVVANLLKLSNLKNIVIDPVLKASSGENLLEEEGLRVIGKELLPLATIVTPNIPEAEMLIGEGIRTKKDMERAAIAIKELGPDWVLIKGGHLNVGEGFIPSQNTDLLYNGNRFFYFEGTRYPAQMRGTGCIFASSLAGHLALGKTVEEATLLSKNLVTKKIKKAIKLGKGRPQASFS